MRMEPWQDKGLHTALGSWSQMRHDTILYVKESATITLGLDLPVMEAPPPGYVEPQAEFLARLASLNAMTRRGLEDLGCLDEATARRLDGLDVLLGKALGVTRRELEGSALDAADAEFLDALPGTLASLVAGVDVEGIRTTIVADVHTDANSGQVLEVGTGRLDLCVVAAPRADGTFFLAAGPVFTHYEFKHLASDRLTDGAWGALLSSPDVPSLPEWTETYRVR
jgi:hypothetical protein